MMIVNAPWKYNVPTIVLMTSSGSEPMWNNSHPTDSLSRTQVHVKSASPELSAQSTDAQRFAHAFRVRRGRGSLALVEDEGDQRIFPKNMHGKA
eukprot:12933199-Prorocentrum_lima.AAC.1